MKRVSLALFLLATVVGLCVGSLFYLRNQIDEMLIQTDKLDAAYRDGNRDDSIRLAKDLSAAYTHCVRRFGCFMSHNELDGSMDTVATLSACLEEDNPEEFLLELAKLRQQLRFLQQAEVPLLHNIL